MPRGSNNQKITREQAVQALRKANGVVAEAARLTGVSRNSIINHRKKAMAEGIDVPLPPVDFSKGECDPNSTTSRVKAAEREELEAEEDPRPLTGGRVDPIEIVRRPLPKKRQVKTYIITGAVNNTDIHLGLWSNIQALAEHYDAEIIVRPILYNLNAYRRMGADTEDVDAEEGADIHFDAAVKPYFQSSRIELAPGLHFAGDAPITATAASPLSGYKTFTGEASGIFAATRVEMAAVATMKRADAKMLYTTGVVTQRNYTETKTGQKADWHHSYGAILVEVDSDGDYFVRHLGSSEDGSINDLGLTVRNGRVQECDNIAALTPGDIHVAQLQEHIKKAIFGPKGMVDQLRPAEVHLHDLHDHQSRSHHNTRNPFTLYELHNKGRESVADEIRKNADFLNYASREWLRLVVVGSNHDDHLRRWVAETDWKSDPINARFYLQCALKTIDAISSDDKQFHLLEWACRDLGAPDDVVFLRPDQSWRVFDIECGLHGDKGVNGGRGTLKSLSQTGSKLNIGHSHSPGIVDGAWQCGVTGGTEDLDMGYNEGPSSWSRTLIATYVGGKRTMITMRGLKWRAARPKKDSRHGGKTRSSLDRAA